tara:strand:- start:3850 stop:5031 length:1182 start_codon:yes stop_codon:yes gene_type:complete
MSSNVRNQTTVKDAVEVVIFDERGSEWLKKCVPQNIKTLVLASNISRKHLCHPAIFSGLLKWFFIGNFENLGVRGRWIAAYFIALVERISPAIVISNNDGSEIIRAIALNNKTIFVAVVQLALRERYRNAKIKTFPTYFSFGQAQEKLFSASQVKCHDIRPVGSLRNSIYLATHKNKKNDQETAFRIVFISQWKRGLCLNPKLDLYKAWNEGHRKTFQAVHRYAEERSIKLDVVLRNTFDHDDNMELQKKYFFEAAQSSQLNFFSSRTNELASYSPTYVGDIVVHFFSTLGFEVFGYGKKVLCCIGLGGGKQFIDEFGVQELIESLPSEVLLSANKEHLIGDMINKLIDMPSPTYESLTKKARNYYMSMEEGQKTHESIKLDLAKILKIKNNA